MSDPRGSTSWTYDANGERRDLPTGMTVTGKTGGGADVGTFTAAYDSNGQPVSMTYPNGMVKTTAYDEVDDSRTITYRSATGQVWLTDSQTSTVHGQWATHTGTPSAQTYGYDRAGRLTAVAEQRAGSSSTCTGRSYTFDLDSNRTASSEQLPAGDSCTSVTSTHAYDQADRLLPHRPRLRTGV